LRWGIYGVAAAYALVTLLIFYPGFVIPIRLIDLNAREFFARLAPPFLNSLLMAGFLVTAHHFILAELAAPLRLIIMMTAGAAVYALSSWYFNGHQTRQILATVRVKL
jgi:PST family polysaccharide transporter